MILDSIQWYLIVYNQSCVLRIVWRVCARVQQGRHYTLTCELGAFCLRKFSWLPLNLIPPHSAHTFHFSSSWKNDIKRSTFKLSVDSGEKRFWHVWGKIHDSVQFCPPPLKAKSNKIMDDGCSGTWNSDWLKGLRTLLQDVGGANEHTR